MYFLNQALASATASWKQLWAFQPPSTRHAIRPASFLSIPWRLQGSRPLPAGGEKGRPSVVAQANADSDANLRRLINARHSTAQTFRVEKSASLGDSMMS